MKKAADEAYLALRVFARKSVLFSLFLLTVAARMLWHSVWIDVANSFFMIVTVVDVIHSVASGEISLRRPQRQVTEAPVALDMMPPRAAELALWLFIPRRHRDEIVGDLEEQFKRCQARLGRRNASIWYAKEVGLAVYPNVSRFVKWVGSIGLGSFLVNHWADLLRMLGH